ncbi:MAG: FliH/SctL family protein [Myxococcota bacterium]
MFSFRPDAEASPIGFVPTPIRVALPADPEPASLAASESEAPEPVAAASPEPVAPTPEEIAALEQAAFDRGVATVQAEQAALDATLAAMDEAIAGWRAATAALVSAQRAHVLDLVQVLVRHWVGAELEGQPATYAALLDRALDDVEGPAPVRLSLCAADLARLESRAAAEVARWRSADVEIRGEDSLGAGSFVIETPSAEIEGDLDAIAARLREALDPALAAPLSGGAEPVLSSEADEQRVDAEGME